jgi:hypothetical protein
VSLAPGYGHSSLPAFGSGWVVISFGGTMFIAEVKDWASFMSLSSFSLSWSLVALLTANKRAATLAIFMFFCLVCFYYYCLDQICLFKYIDLIKNDRLKLYFGCLLIYEEIDKQLKV